MNVFFNIIQVNKEAAQPIYLQVADCLVKAILSGQLKDGSKLPGTRVLARLTGLHRNTLVASYAELEAQGLIQSFQKRGTFVHFKPEDAHEKMTDLALEISFGYPDLPAFEFKRWTLFDSPFTRPKAQFWMNDGLPDNRVSHLEYLSRLVSFNMRRKSTVGKLAANNMDSKLHYNEQLLNHLNSTRGLRAASKNLLVSKSHEMALHIIAETLISSGDKVIIAELSYFSINMILQKSGAKLLKVPIEHDGIDVDAVERLCKKQQIRMLYLTPHFHYPTTVTLSLEKRKKLLEIAAKYGFIILEDDLYFDLSYQETQLLPLSAMENKGMTIYVGTFGSTLPNAFRTGYVVASSALITEMEKLNQLMDRYGDVLSELAMAELIADRKIFNQFKQSLQVYKQRRNLFCELLVSELGHILEFDVPDGGLAVWTRWPGNVNLLKFSNECLKKGLHIPPYLLYQTKQISGIRMGFGSFDEKELALLVGIMRASIV